MNTGSRTAGAAVLILLFFAGCTMAAEGLPPNVILLLVDDLGWADLGCYGADLHETPSIDRLAARGVRFTDAYAAASVCTPTRAALLTGKAPGRLHMTVWREASRNPPEGRPVVPPVTEENLPLEEVTLAERFRAAGYATAIVGKWHLGGAEYYPENQGFDINIGGTCWGAPQTFFWPYRGNKRYGGEPRYVPGLHYGKPGEYLTDRLTDEAISILRKWVERPFFLQMSYHTVHTPIEAPAEDVAYYRGKLAGGMKHANPIYAAMVGRLDRSVGRLLDELDRLGIAKNTIVVLTSDNGGYVNEYEGTRVTNNAPLRSGKGSLWEGGIRVPLVIYRPGIDGAVCHEPVVTTDLYRTLLAMTGVDGGESGIDGADISPLLEDPNGSLGREALYWHFPHYYPTTTPVGAIRHGDWKLLEFFEDGRLELYHLRQDLSESTNLVEKEPKIAAELHGMLRKWRTEVNAQMPVQNRGVGGSSAGATGCLPASVDPRGLCTRDGQP